MNPIETAREQALRALMETYGDAVLRSCLLLCGDIDGARQAARAVFLLAAEELPVLPLQNRPETLRRLLALVLRRCPCPILPPRTDALPLPLSRFLVLSPAGRRIAMLCCYNGLTTDEAAALLRIPAPLAAQRLARVRSKLRDL